MNKAVDHDEAPQTLFGKLLELLSDSFIYGLSTLLTQITGFLLLPIYTRHLTPEDYGVLAMLNVLAMTFTPLAGFCLTSAVYRRLNLRPDEATRGIVLSTGLAGVGLCACTMLAIGWIFARWPAIWLVGNDSAAPLVRISMLTSALILVGDVARVDLRSRRLARTVGALNLTAFVVTLTITIWLVVFNQSGVAGVVWGGAGGALFGMLAAFWVTRKRFPMRFDKAELRCMLQYGGPIVPSRLVAVGLMTYSQYYVREMLGLDEAGLYDIALRFVLPIGLVVSAIQEAWVPYKFQIHERDKRPQDFFRESFTYYLALILYLWVGVAAWGPELLRLMTDAKYHTAASLVTLTGLVRVMWGVYVMMSSGIELSDDTRPFSLISAAGLIVVVACTLFAVPALGAAGAAISTSAGYFAMAVVARWLARTRLAIDYDWPRIAAITSVAVGCVLLTYFTASMPTASRLTMAASTSLAYPICTCIIVMRRKSNDVAWPKSTVVEESIGRG